MKWTVLCALQRLDGRQCPPPTRYQIVETDLGQVKQQILADTQRRLARYKNKPGQWVHLLALPHGDGDVLEGSKALRLRPDYARNTRAILRARTPDDVFAIGA